MFSFYFFCICFQARHPPQRVSQRTVCNIYDNAHQLTSIKRTLRPYLFSTFSWSKGETRMIWILLIFLKKNLGRVTKNSILRNHCRISDITIKLKVSFCINLQYLLDWLYISLHYLVAGFFPFFWQNVTTNLIIVKNWRKPETVPLLTPKRFMKWEQIVWLRASSVVRDHGKKCL